MFLRLQDTEINLCKYVGVTLFTHAHYGDNCHFAIVKVFMVATDVKCFLYSLV